VPPPVIAPIQLDIPAPDPGPVSLINLFYQIFVFIFIHPQVRPTVIPALQYNIPAPDPEPVSLIILFCLNI
jgi:hypothetical protein